MAAKTQQKSKKTLALNTNLMKKVRFKGTDAEDITSYFKAYLLGAFDEVHPDFKNNSMAFKKDFETLFSNYVQINSLLSVTFFSLRDGVEIPVGVGIFWPRERVLQISDLVWFPWASKRDIFENSLNFYDTVRKTKHTRSDKFYKILEFAHEKDEKFFDKMVDLKILEKIGKIEDLYPESKAIFYVSKAVK